MNVEGVPTVTPVARGRAVVGARGRGPVTWQTPPAVATADVEGVWVPEETPVVGRRLILWVDRKLPSEGTSETAACNNRVCPLLAGTELLLGEEEAGGSGCTHVFPCCGMLVHPKLRVGLPEQCAGLLLPFIDQILTLRVKGDN